MADTICAERGTARGPRALRRVPHRLRRGMEPEHRRIVRNLAFLFLCVTKSPPVMYNLTLELQYLFMRKRPQTKTFLLEGKR
jgi:hypothetical protein